MNYVIRALQKKLPRAPLPFNRLCLRNYTHFDCPLVYSCCRYDSVCRDGLLVRESERCHVLSWPNEHAWVAPIASWRASVPAHSLISKFLRQHLSVPCARNGRTVKFFSPSPVLIRKIFENHQSDPVLIRLCKSWYVKSWIFILLHETKTLLQLFCLQLIIFGWRQNSSSGAFASSGKIDIAFWHFQNLTRQCLFCLMKQSTAGVILPLGESHSLDCSNDKDDTGYTWISIKSL